MSVTPAGVLSKNLSNAKDLFAASSDFQSWVDVETAAAAKAYIHLVGVSKTSITRPFLRLSQGSEWAADYAAGGARNHFLYSGSIYAYFEASISAAYVSGYEDAEFEFTNSVGNILQDVLNLSASDGYLPVKNIRKIEGPTRTKEKNDSSLGNIYTAKFELFWTR